MNEQEKQEANKEKNTNYSAPRTTNEIQKDLEKQLKILGETATEAVRYGISENAGEMGTAAIGVAAAFAESVQKEVQKMREQDKAAKKAAQVTAAQQIKENQKKYEAYRYSAQQIKNPAINTLSKLAGSRSGIGMAQAICGAIIGFPCLIGGVIAVLASAPEVAFLPPLFLGGVFITLFSCGTENIEISKRIKQYSKAVDTNNSASYEDLAQTSARSKSYVKKDLKKFVRKGWITTWVDESNDVIFFSQEAYKEAMLMNGMAMPNMDEYHEVKEGKETVSKEQKEHEFLQNMQSFIMVLDKQEEIMQDERAAEELVKMRKISQSMYDWLKAHPENTSKMRRFSNYYIPTTLKLLHSYNDVQGKHGENAESIRSDVTGILHTLNTAFQNLHDTLLSDVALDISAEISAMQGMLAQDGLSVEGEI